MSGQTEYILSYFLHGSILCLGIYMSVIKPSICFSKRVISAKWRNKLLIHNINLTVHRNSAYLTVHRKSVCNSWFPWRHKSSLRFGIGGPRFSPRVAATRISKHFVNLGIIIYHEKYEGKMARILFNFIIHPSYERVLKHEMVKSNIFRTSKYLWNQKY